MTSKEKEALLILNHLTALNTVKAKKLIEHFGSAQEVLNSKEYAHWHTCTEWQEDLALVERLGVHVISYQESHYPAALLSLADHPLILYVQGEIQAEDESAVALVGTRLCSIYGREIAEQFATHLAEEGICVVSGLALGIDTAAHIGALKRGRTIAFIGSGLGHIYPKDNQALAIKIANQGAVVSEFPMNFTPQKHHFPRRNRLISAFCKAVLLIEAPMKSGAMLTMDYATAQKKICFTIPGRIDSESFRGNHYLIKNQRAYLVENVPEMVSLLDIQRKNASFLHSRPPAQLDFFDLSAEQQQLISSLPQSEVSVEEISARTGLPIAKLNALLMELVLKDKIREFPGKLYKKVTT